ncbi:MAG: hypothetical protein A3D35_00470 [Candidatus Staskawiczbacteria bacterium RIFCSPHIGHO2_02_FULL_34_9]|uniref:Glutamyl/glutaminyl-tRNA synthetase class Ib catalytic domain-containing protein n=1 Tax=Candidatus Staskawiczbacteria bacterium RIFCSPHIGHO2_02_FULL_34_9 TaxID=1802206 RepID=A0A1G2I047_9BACT|nr:MAG: hypothetical protein A3D35_00470 [Candidatus Staskawiczbacteria bacterium RIFCSPHIGHO2_02_FULL_34_9]
MSKGAIKIKLVTIKFKHVTGGFTNTVKYVTIILSSLPNNISIDLEEKMNKSVLKLEVSPVDSNKAIGPVRSHLYSFSMAQKMRIDGFDVKCIIKCDDSDPKKHKKQNFREVYDFLSTLGVKADIHPYNSDEVLGCSLFQSERGQIYSKYLERLLDSGFVSLADDSRLTTLDVKKFVQNFGSKIIANDELLGDLSFELGNIFKDGKTNFPLTRSDGSCLFNLISVADDLELGVTHVIRGQDKIHVIPVQEMIRMVLGVSSPVYIHLPLLCSENGKRTGGYIQFDELEKSGISMPALISYALSSGYGNPDGIFFSLEEFIAQFDLKNVHKINTNFCKARLENINKRMSRILTSSQYWQTVQCYAAQYYDSQKTEKIMKDENVQHFLDELRLPPAESIDLVNRIFFPKETPIDHALVNCVKQVVEKLKSNPEFDTLSISFAHFSKDVFSKSLRWILIRETGGVELKKIFSLLREKGLISKRINCTEEALGQSF